MHQPLYSGLCEVVKPFFFCLSRWLTNSTTFRKPSQAHGLPCGICLLVRAGIYKMCHPARRLCPFSTVIISGRSSPVSICMFLSVSLYALSANVYRSILCTSKGSRYNIADLFLHWHIKNCKQITWTSRIMWCMTRCRTSTIQTCNIPSDFLYNIMLLECRHC